MNRFQTKLKRLESQNRLRSLNLAQGIDLTSNDYLGMRGHSALRAAAIEALEAGMDIGSGGSRLLRGHTDAHAALEDYAADYFGFEKALYFATGFQANGAVFQALPNRHDVIIYDEFIHASAREAIHYSPARSIKIRHNDLNAFEDALQNEKSKKSTEGMIWVAVESVYSMDGDFAPITELQLLCHQYDAYCIVDEAHATGVYEPVRGENVVSIHTCGKAVGVAGGLVCASNEMISMLINTARGFIYSTAPMPLQAYLTQKSLEILASEEGDARRDRLNSRVQFMKANSQIVPVILGDDARAAQVAAALQREGFDVRAIRPPTVPEGTARLRISLSSELSEKDLKDFSDCLGNILEGKIAA